MKKLCASAVILAFACCGVLLVNGCRKKTVAIESGKVISAEKTSFQEVTSKLDTGGDFYLYLDTEHWLENLSGKIASWREMAATIPDLQGEQITNGLNLATQLVKDSGIEDVSGVGVSSVAREPGFYYSKMFVHHYSDQGNGFLWTLFGKGPHDLDGLDLLPVNTAMATFYDVDAAEAWSVIQKEVEQSGFPDAKDFLKKLPGEFEKNSGMKWKDLVGSFGAEFGFVVTLDDSKMVKIPTQEKLEIPEPALMLVAKVKNDDIFDRIDESMKKNRQRGGLIRVDKDGLKMRTMAIPNPMRMNLRPSVASSEGYLFFSSSDALVREALAVKGGKAGLKSTEEFKKLSQGVPQQGNQFCYVSQRFSQAMMKIQKQALERNDKTPQAVKNLMQSFLQSDKAGYIFSVGANTDEGWITVANGSQSGGKVFAVSAVAVPVLAAIAIPNFAKARQAAQKNACINNLRQIDAAKHQWALEKNKQSTDVATWGDILPYLGRGQVAFRCPQGGEYIIGSLGEAPQCSVAGHALP